jgi:thioredoxin-like negative regulator of GroEL
MSQRREEKRDSSSAGGAAVPGFSPLAEGTYHAHIAASSGLAVVLFAAPLCGACRAWKRLLPAALGDVADAFFEVDVSEATGVARYFGIHHLPTIYLYRDGVFHAELQCGARKDVVLEAARTLLAGPPQDEP